MVATSSDAAKPDMIPDALAPDRDLGEANPEFSLLEGRVQLSKGGVSLELERGALRFSSTPSPRIQLTASGESSNPAWLGRAFQQWQPDSFDFVDAGVQGSLREYSAVGGDFRSAPAQLTFTGDILRVVKGGSTDLSSVTFALMNFGGYLGAAVKRGNSLSRGRLTLEGGGWSVVLDERAEFSSLKEHLRESGGFAFTHIGRLERSDGCAFSDEDASDLLSGLHWFLSFVRGIWVCPVLYSGRTSDGNVVWEDWDPGRVGRWAGPPSWCDPTNWKAAEEAFQGYMSLWEDPFENAVLRTSVGQYVSANNPSPVETAITVAQSGLELLGWVEFVETNRVSKADWENSRSHPAAKRISLLLDECSADKSIPSALKNLQGLDGNWQSGPAVVAGVRNRLVHPRKSADRVSWPREVLCEAWLLMSRYLELCILHRLGVTSGIRDRLDSNVWVGSISPPPWVSP